LGRDDDLNDAAIVVATMPLARLRMTMAQMTKRLAAIEKRLGDLQQTLDYQQAVEGIRRGLESVDRGEGEPASRVFRDLRRKHGFSRRR
jgi:hypothetical protein